MKVYLLSELRYSDGAYNIAVFMEELSAKAHAKEIFGELDWKQSDIDGAESYADTSHLFENSCVLVQRLDLHK